MIQKHAIPILEFDDNPQAVIMPNHEGLDLQLPKKCIYAFLEEEIDRFAQEEGCAVVEMECAALAAVAQLRGAVWGQLLFTADSLADLENYDSRDWGAEAFDKALELCLEIVSHM